MQNPNDDGFEPKWRHVPLGIALVLVTAGILRLVGELAQMAFH